MENIVYIKWKDARSAYGGWTAQEDIDASTPIIETVGFLLEDDEDHVAIVSAVADDGDVINMLTIPKQMIIEKRVLIVRE